ncbi:MAG: hypothetical protein VB862_13665, partial [Pirellulaceae bacterium]
AAAESEDRTTKAAAELKGGLGSSGPLIATTPVEVSESSGDDSEAEEAPEAEESGSDDSSDAAGDAGTDASNGDASGEEAEPTGDDQEAAEDE